MAVHFRAEMPQVILTLEVGHDHAGRRVSAEELASLDHDLTQALRPGLYGIGSTDLPGRVVHALKRAGLWLATAESCTGGQVASMVTSVPSASACFRGGLVAYSNQLKTRLLEVPPTLIETHGAVSEPVARAMAEGARAAFQADFALATTGIAGPAGGTPEKPVGTVHAAVSAAGGTSHRKLNLRGDRGTIQRSAALWLLKLVWDQLEEQGAATIEDSSTEPTIG
jgi:nicotinamide-nucleotide amidase